MGEKETGTRVEESADRCSVQETIEIEQNAVSLTAFLALQLQLGLRPVARPIREKRTGSPRGAGRPLFALSKTHVGTPTETLLPRS